jgi:hypothetical protein
MDWYEENIEEGVRDIVRRLRNEGVNTVSSCHHDGTIQCSYFTEGQVMRLDNTIFNWLNEIGAPKNYTITVTVERIGGHSYRTMEVVGLPRQAPGEPVTTHRRVT